MRHNGTRSHIFYDGKMYNDRDLRWVTSQGAVVNGIEHLKHDVVARGVLLDVPRWRGLRWLENGTAIGTADLDACAEAQG